MIQKVISKKIEYLGYFITVCIRREKTTRNMSL
nr:MAG TPA: hypothetical protein [Caudoviricetes sp.]